MHTFNLNLPQLISSLRCFHASMWTLYGLWSEDSW